MSRSMFLGIIVVQEVLERHVALHSGASSGNRVLLVLLSCFSNEHSVTLCTMKFATQRVSNAHTRIVRSFRLACMMAAAKVALPAGRLVTGRALLQALPTPPACRPQCASLRNAYTLFG